MRLAGPLKANGVARRMEALAGSWPGVGLLVD